METKKGLTGKEKFAYGIGAVGKDMVYMLSASYVLYYFQDILKTSAIAMGIILLVARVFDAFNDPIMGVVVAKTKTRWGSCSSKGNLNFNCLLALCPEGVMRYVVVHELSHRRHMNHSKAFWSMVEEYMPDYKEQKLYLKRNGDLLMARL